MLLVVVVVVVVVAVVVLRCLYRSHTSSLMGLCPFIFISVLVFYQFI